MMAPTAFQHDASWPKAEIDAINATEPDGEPEPSDDPGDDDPDDDDQEDPHDADGGNGAEVGGASEVCIFAVNTVNY